MIRHIIRGILAAGEGRRGAASARYAASAATGIWHAADLSAITGAPA